MALWLGVHVPGGHANPADHVRRQFSTGCPVSVLETSLRPQRFELEPLLLGRRRRAQGARGEECEEARTSHGWGRERGGGT